MNFFGQQKGLENSKRVVADPNEVPIETDEILNAKAIYQELIDTRPVLLDEKAEIAYQNY